MSETFKTGRGLPEIYVPKKMSYIDLHSHLDMASFNGERQNILNQCFDEAGFSLVVIAADPYDSCSPDTAARLSERNPRVYTMIAAHPHEAKHYSDTVRKVVIRYLGHKKNIAVGEAGLDYHYRHSTPAEQKMVFRDQIALAREFSKPMVIHCREAEGDVLGILQDAEFNQPVVFHSYTGTMRYARDIIDRGYGISFSGIVTFKKSQYLRDIVRIVPLNQLFTETDAPYLAPVPHRGKLNTPLYVRETAAVLAELKGISPEELNKRVYDNFSRFFLRKEEDI